MGTTPGALQPIHQAGRQQLTRYLARDKIRGRNQCACIRLTEALGYMMMTFKGTTICPFGSVSMATSVRLTPFDRNCETTQEQTVQFLLLRKRSVGEDQRSPLRPRLCSKPLVKAHIPLGTVKSHAMGSKGPTCRR